MHRIDVLDFKGSTAISGVAIAVFEDFSAPKLLCCMLPPQQI
jgi:hypothetical protein